MVPRAVLMKYGLVSVNTARQVNAAHSKTIVNAARPVSYLSKIAHSTGNPHMDLQDQGVIDSGCSRHMTGNMSYLTDYEEIDGGYVAFGGNPKGGKITRKCTIKTVPRKNNMYSVDLKNIVPKGGLTCLFEKATSDESKLWHRRLGHLNIKTMNKLVKGNLVRGLPSKLFDNDQTCVACQKGKQHRASCKSKTENSISLPLHMLHMDLFGPTFVKSLMKKMYCLVITDDFSRFTWLFFLATKDETSGILKSFITRIENLVDHKVKVVRCPVTILNTINHLSKFNGKADEGFFVGYSLNSKAFRVFNSRTRIMEENLHIRFSESTPNVVSSGPDWLFDIDALTRTMNYEPIIVGTQSNGFADSKSSHDDRSKPLSDNGKKVDEDPRKESGCNDQEKEDNVNSTNNVNAASTNEVNAIGGKTSIEFPFDPNMPALEDYRDDEDDGVEADLNNLDTTIQVSPIPNTRIHKDHHLDQVIGDLQLATQTRRMSKKLEEHGFEEPKKVIHALKDPSWIEAMQEELLQFNLQEVWTLMNLPNGKRAIGTKWVFRNKKDKRGIVDKYVDEILKKFGFTNVKTASTPMETQKPLLKDENGEEVDVYMYRSMIGSLMYLTSSRPDIMFAVYACARYQVNLKVSHLHAVKRIFRYLKCQPKLGLWYLKDSPFDLVAYTDSDYAGASLDRKSMIGGCQFLICRLISWQCKKQTVVANSITEAEYVAASSCCGQVIWIQNQLLDYGYNFMHTKFFIDNNSTICIIKNPVFHSKTKHIEIRHHFIRDYNEKKLIQMAKIYTDKNVTDLLTKDFDVSRFQYLIVSIGMMNL
ncbi:putative ribonuclease H-like domain-containing protein [Tanacetum coccineum]